MMNKPILTLIIALFYSCGPSQTFTKDKMLTDFLAVDAIAKAKVQNNYGTFLLSKTQLEDLKKALKKLSYEPDQHIKVGAKGVSFTIDKKVYYLATRTVGEMAEITINNESYVFKTNGLNLDSYKEN